MPDDLDVSMCSNVGLRGCDFKDIKELKFREGAVVDLGLAKNLPHDLDFSMCSEVSLGNLDGVERIKFKNKEQEKEFMKYAKNFSGKAVYAGQNVDASYIKHGDNSM